MDPIKIQISVVPDEEINHLRLRNAKLQQNYDELSRQMDGLRMMYSELLQAYTSLKRSVMDK